MLDCPLAGGLGQGWPVLHHTMITMVHHTWSNASKPSFRPMALLHTLCSFTEALIVSLRVLADMALTVLVLQLRLGWSWWDGLRAVWSRQPVSEAQGCTLML